MVRVAILDRERCKPKDCDEVCRRYCPQVRSRIEAITFEGGSDKAIILERLCTGCGICVKKCPFKAISIVNLPEEIEGECSHRYGPNQFKLYRLPVPQPGLVTGLIGRNGTGKSTALKILSGEIDPNLGRLESPPTWQEIVRHYRGSVLQDYFERLSRKELKVVHKPQHVDTLPSLVKGKVSSILRKVDEKGIMKQTAQDLQIDQILDRQIDVLSGGELQAVAITAAISREADVYIFDEPSSHLDVSQRMRAARLISSLVRDNKIVIMAEHDLAMLDYLSDQICVLYGEPGVYGIVSHVHGVRVGINIFLDGFIPDENMRFRDEPIRFHVRLPREERKGVEWNMRWDQMKKNYPKFQLTVEAGQINRGDVIGIVGPNGIGKTTFIKLLAGIEKPDSGQTPSLTELTISYKPQYISATYSGSVESLLRDIAGDRFGTEIFQNEIIRRLHLESLVDRGIENLSGGELQRVAIAACLAREAQLYLLDEPSAFLDVEERISMARAIRRIVEDREAFCFIVEHDIVAQDFIADRLMIFSGDPGSSGRAGNPVSLREGMNRFLKEMQITFRRDANTGRPRVNKPESKTDRTQKELGQYYYISE